MAAGFLNTRASDLIDVVSAGSTPAAEVNPVAVQVMEELGIDLRRAAPKQWTSEMLEAADVVVTMGCGDACPVIPGKRYIDWEVEDPAGRTLEEVRTIRDDIGKRVSDLLSELGAIR